MKKFLSFILALVLILGSSASAFADGEEMEFTGEEIALSLEQVVEHIMTTGTGIQLVEIHKLSDKAIADGYADSYQTVKDALDMINNMPFSMAISMGLTGQVEGIDEVVLKKTRDFAKSNLEKNYQADLNNLESSAYSLYYQTLQAQEYYKISEEALANAQNTYDVVQKKYNLGSASKLELLSAENSLTSAKSDLVAAKAAYSSARMNFNMQMGYDLLANTVLTQEIERAAEPEITLEEAVASALENRNEVGQVAFGYDLQKTMWTHTKLVTGYNSAEYQKQKAAFLQMEYSYNNLGTQIELSIRAEYLNLQAKKEAAKAAESTAALAETAYRIQQISYNLGACTLNDLQATLTQLNGAKLAEISAVCDYNQAVQTFIFDCGVGTTRIDL